MAKIVAKISYFLAFEVISLLLHIEISWNSPIVCRIRYTNDSQSFKKIYQRISELWTIMAKIVAKISYFLAFEVISMLLHIEISWNSPIVCRIRYTNDSQSFKKIYQRISELWTIIAKIVAKISYFLAFDVGYLYFYSLKVLESWQYYVKYDELMISIIWRKLNQPF